VGWIGFGAKKKKELDKNTLKGLLAILAMFWFGVRAWVSDVGEGICIKHKNNKQLTAYSRTPTVPPLENHDKSVID
jgi:hypothetical protein